MFSELLEKRTKKRTLPQISAQNLKMNINAKELNEREENVEKTHFKLKFISEKRTSVN